MGKREYVREERKKYVNGWDNFIYVTFILELIGFKKMMVVSFMVASNVQTCF